MRSEQGRLDSCIILSEVFRSVWRILPFRSVLRLASSFLNSCSSLLCNSPPPSKKRRKKNQTMPFADLHLAQWQGKLNNLWLRWIILHGMAAFLFIHQSSLSSYYVKFWLDLRRSRVLSRLIAWRVVATRVAVDLIHKDVLMKYSDY